MKTTSTNTIHIKDAIFVEVWHIYSEEKFHVLKKYGSKLNYICNDTVPPKAEKRKML